MIRIHKIRKFLASRIRYLSYRSGSDLAPEPSSHKQNIKKNLYVYVLWLLNNLLFKRTHVLYQKLG